MKKLWNISPFNMAVFAAALLFAGVSFLFDWRVGLAETVAVILLLIIARLRVRSIYSVVYDFLTKFSQNLDPVNRDALEGFPMPTLVSDTGGKILWFNELFHKNVLGNVQLRSNSLSQFMQGYTLRELLDNDSISLEYNNKMYTVYTNKIVHDNNAFYVLYFIDDTELKLTQIEYRESQPGVMLITIDSLDELVKDVRESEQAALIGGVEQILENWIGETNGFIKKLSRGRFLSVVEERHLRGFIEKRFDILDKVRSYSYANISGATLSIGVGCGDTMADSEALARQALDMALGRGGDQAAVKTKTTYEFFGGVSKGVEKRTKVRTRIIASAISELIEGSENVLIMGHRFADLDAFGACIGMWKIARTLGKPANIVISRSRSLVAPLLERIEKYGIDGITVEPENAVLQVTKKTLLIICDTHRADFAESPDLFDICKTIVVIDHHRKTVDHIDNAVIFFHEPYASSTSEMVAELSQYISDKPIIGRMEAEALLSGIMLDTRNFVMRTGVRTFEAAAYLRSCGADTVDVKRFFSGSMESYRLRSSIVGSADTYRGCAIAVTQVQSNDIRVISSQAADELLNINGVKASFVIFQTGSVVNISARSMGEMNVQVVMEAVGGGGHQTMAAAQLKDVSADEARELLMRAVDKALEKS